MPTLSFYLLLAVCQETTSQLKHQKTGRVLSIEYFHVFICAPLTDTSSSFLAVDSAPMAVGLFRLLARRSGTRYQTNSDPACSFDSFRQFLKTILFSLYYSVRYALYKSTFYLLTRLLTYDYYYYYYHSFSIASDSGSVHK